MHLHRNAALVALLLASLHNAALAQVRLYKCMGANKHLLVQDTPCPVPGQSTEYKRPIPGQKNEEFLPRKKGEPSWKPSFAEGQEAPGAAQKATPPGEAHPSASATGDKHAPSKPKRPA
jgi:hypothetical protein